MFDEDAEFVNVVGLWWHNRADIRKAHAYGLQRIFKHSTLRAATVRVKHLADDIAVVHARMVQTNQTAIGTNTAPASRQTILTFVVHRTSEGWRCAAAHNTDVVPNMETNAVGPDGKLSAVDYRQHE